MVNGIYDKIRLLREHPRIGQRYAPIADREVREILYGHYRIAYLIETDDRLEILGIFHGAMEIDLSWLNNNYQRHSPAMLAALQPKGCVH